MELIKYELKKIKPGYLFVLLFILLVVEILVLHIGRKNDYGFDIYYYKKYIKELSKSDAQAYIEEEEIRLNSILNKEQEMEIKYSFNEISLLDYKDFRLKYTKATIQQPAFEAAKTRYEYLKKLEERGVKVSYCYEKEIEELLKKIENGRLLVWLIVVIVTVLISNLDYDYKTLDLIKTTPLKKRCYWIQFILIILISLFISLASILGQLIIFLKKDNYIWLSQMIVNLEYYSSFSDNVKVIDFLNIEGVKLTVFSVAIGIASFFITKLSRKKILSIFVLSISVLLFYI